MNKLDKGIVRYKNIAMVISATMLFLAIPSIWPYGYYVFLRWVVSITSLFVMLICLDYDLRSIRKWVYAVIFLSIFVLFNPIAPVYLDKGTWVIIDLVVAILFLASIPTIKPKCQ